MEESVHMAVLKQPRLLEIVRQRICLKRYSYRTEKSYVHWIRHFVRFYNRCHPRELGKVNIKVFLTHLALEHGDGTFERSSVATACYPQPGSRTGFESRSIHAVRVDTEIRRVLAPKQPFGRGH
jgi:hypothetical protein